jgi:thiamine biosynthesis protein ThiI
VLLSGGIDSPVAAYQMAKRGLRLESVTFPTYPYTSEQALEKVKKLALLLSPWNLGMRIHSVPFTDVSMHIKKNAPDEAMTLLLRASMMRAAEILAKTRDAKCLITGESLSQVASQTVESMAFTGSVVTLPVFRPLISLDKSEIVEIAKRIGTYETSILPYEDCCTVFAPKRPMISPDLEKITELYRNLEIENWLEEAVKKTESQWYSHQESF